MKLIKINSSKDLFVYGTSFTQNTPNAQKDFNINAQTWIGTKVLIKRGIHTYPAEIGEWQNIRDLEERGILTISNGGEGMPEDSESVGIVKKVKEFEKEAVVQKKTEELINKRNATMKNLATTIVEKEMMKNGGKE